MVKSEQNLSPIWRLETLNIPGIRQLSEGHSLSEALAAFIQSFADGSFNAAYKEVDGRVDKFGFPELFSIHVTMYWPLAAASVRR